MRTQTSRHTVAQRSSSATGTVRSAEHHSSEHVLLRLQRQIGNQAVGRLLHQPGGLTVIQRLSLYNTNWNDVTRIRKSGTGQTGVLFVEDATDKGLVVKPSSTTDPALETLVAHTVHQKLSKRKAKVPHIRLAEPAEKSALRMKVYEVLEASEEQMREAGCSNLQEFKSWVSFNFITDKIFIMEKVSGQEFGQVVKNYSAVAKGLLLSPDYAERLGFITAVDLFLGNTDRLLSGNVGNWMTNISRYDEAISLIDNFDPFGFAAQRLNADSQENWRGTLLPKLLDLNTTAEEVMNSIDLELRRRNLRLTDQEKEQFKTHFVRGLKKGRERILSKLAPMIGRRSRTLKHKIQQFEGGQEAWFYLKERAAALRWSR